jgi:cell division protease FtsH
MSDIHFASTPTDPQSDGAAPAPRRAWIVWLILLGGIIGLLLFKDRMAGPGEVISQFQFEQLVNSNLIVHAVVNYDPQNSAVNEVAGTYRKTENSGMTETPFRARIRLTGGMEERLYSLPQFEPHQPNTVLASLVWSILPIIVIAVLIWFFFIRQIRIAGKAATGATNSVSRTAEQQNRFDKLLDKWEAQSRRLDAVLDKWERDNTRN